MATSEPIAVTTTRVDLIDSEGLAIGTYSIQNIGGSPVYYAERDAAVADPDDILGAHVMTPLGTFDAWSELDVLAGRAFYVWTNTGQQSLIILTEAS